MTSKFEMFKNLLKSNGKHKMSPGQVYAVGTGIFVGEMFVYVKKDNEKLFNLPNYYLLELVDFRTEFTFSS